MAACRPAAAGVWPVVEVQMRTAAQTSQHPIIKVNVKKFGFNKALKRLFGVFFLSNLCVPCYFKFYEHSFIRWLRIILSNFCPNF